MKKIKQALTQSLGIIPVFLVTVAVIVIGWYLLKNFGVMDKPWALPALAGLTALSLFIPIIARRFTPIYSIAATGWTILIIETFPSIISTSKMPLLLVLLTIIAVVLDLLVNGKASWDSNTIGTDFLLSLIACIFWWLYGSSFLVRLIILLLLFLLVLWPKLQYKISSKNKETIERKRKKQTTSPKTGDTM